MTDNNHLSITPAVEAGRVPEGFHLGFAQRALKGSPVALHLAFKWSRSLKGTKFWLDQFDLLREKRPLTDEAAAILRAWIKEVDARS
jgi:hypothetical protein